MTLGDKTLTVRPATDRSASLEMAGMNNGPQGMGMGMSMGSGMGMAPSMGSSMGMGTGMGSGMGMGTGTAATAPTPQEHMQLAQAMAALDPSAARTMMESMGQGVGGIQSAAVAESVVAANLVRTSAPTRVLVLLNMVTEEDLADPQEYEDIVDDIQQECSSHGTVNAVVIPRPGEADASIAVGKVFVEYAMVESAQKAALSLAGRQFSQRIVKVEYYNEDKFARRDFD
ncbi:unnamed protein product [Discosporangium mesarthrocarpum]